MAQAMIFAAGLGTRLKPLTDTMPKALVRVGGEPLLHHVVMNLRAAGFDRIVVNVHHFARQIVDYLAANGNFGIDIRVSDESDALLDTGGGIRKAAPLFNPDEPILIHNVDIMSNVNLAKFYASAKEHDATLLVSDRQTSRYLTFTDRMRLSGWINTKTGETRGPAPYGTRHAFSGIHVFSPRLFPLMEGFGDKFGIIDFYLKACATADIHGCVKPGLRLLDVGKPDTLREAETFVKQQ